MIGLFKRLLLLAVLMICLSVNAAAEQSFSFELSIDGKQDKQVSTGDLLTVTFTLQRTDEGNAYPMHAMQNEICYDGTFFRLVENSIVTADGVQTGDIALRDDYRAFYMNTLSLNGNTMWENATVVGSFQLEVLAENGASEIFCQNGKVSFPDGRGSYPVVSNRLTVVLSQDCTVAFDTAGGSSVEAQRIKRGSLMQPPADPVRSGYRFAGWYRDIDCTVPWNFTTDRVSVNLRLYAKWEKDHIARQYLDVQRTDWFFADVEYVSACGLMDGVGGGLFAPQQTTSRAMIVTILWRMEGKPATAETISFTDVPSGQWYTDAIGWAAEAGIVTGYSAQLFGPNDSITREQMAAVLYRYAAVKRYDTSSKADLSRFIDYDSVSAWAREAIAWANASSLINGMPGELLAPQSSANRCQMAAILHRFCEKF